MLAIANHIILSNIIIFSYKIKKASSIVQTSLLLFSKGLPQIRKLKKEELNNLRLNKKVIIYTKPYTCYKPCNPKILDPCQKMPKHLV